MSCEGVYVFTSPFPCLPFPILSLPSLPSLPPLPPSLPSLPLSLPHSLPPSLPPSLTHSLLPSLTHSLLPFQLKSKLKAASAEMADYREEQVRVREELALTVQELQKALKLR